VYAAVGLDEDGLGSLVVLSQSLVQKPRIRISIALGIGREKKEGPGPLNLAEASYLLNPCGRGEIGRRAARG
jgi:hypothetical protein